MKYPKASIGDQAQEHDMKMDSVFSVKFLWASNVGMYVNLILI